MQVPGSPLRVDFAPASDAASARKDGLQDLDLVRDLEEFAGTDLNGGARGADGKDGRRGADGKDGAPGANGKDGAPGANGKDGGRGDDATGAVNVVQLDDADRIADILNALTTGDAAGVVIDGTADADTGAAYPLLPSADLHLFG